VSERGFRLCCDNEGAVFENDRGSLMNLGDLKFRIKLQVPSIKDTGMTDDDITDLLNQACDDVNMFGKFYRSERVFNIESEKQIYQISSFCPDYLGIDKGGVWFKYNDEWVEVYPRTKEYLNEFIPNWRSAQSVPVPQYYWVDVDDIGFYQKPSQDITGGGLLCYLKRATPMSNNNHFPYTGTSTEIGALRPIDDALIAYVRWKTKVSLANNPRGVDAFAEYERDLLRAVRQVMRRPDLTIDRSYRLRQSH
jgi:hypothetical protein